MKLLKNYLNNILSRIIQKFNAGNRQSFDEIKLQLGKLNIRVNSNADSQSLKDHEFKVRSKAHHSLLYAGVSLKTIYNLAKIKNYTFLGCSMEFYNTSNKKTEILINES